MSWWNSPVSNGTALIAATFFLIGAGTFVRTTFSSFDWVEKKLDLIIERLFK